MRKKLLAILLVLGLVITCMPMVALAVNSGLSVDKNTFKQGETFTVTINLPQEAINKNLESAGFTMNFDKNELEVTKVGRGFNEGTNVSSTVKDANNNGKIELGTAMPLGGEEEYFRVDTTEAYYFVSFTVKGNSGNTEIKLTGIEIKDITDESNVITISDFESVPDLIQSVTLQLTGADGVEKLKEDAHIKGNVLDVAEEYNVVILYNDDAVYTYIPEEAEDSDINKTYQNAEKGVTLSPTDKDTVRGKWCGYGGGVGFDGNQNRITIINGMDVEGTVTAVAAKDAGIGGKDFSISLTTSGEVDGSANYDILREACLTGRTEEQFNTAFNQCGALYNNAKFGEKVMPTEGIKLEASNHQGKTIKCANMYYSVTGNPGTGMANWGGTVNTTLGTITITVKA